MESFFLELCRVALIVHLSFERWMQFWVNLLIPACGAPSLRRDCSRLAGRRPLSPKSVGKLVGLNWLLVKGG